jgi:hypothetical protein
MEPFLVFSRGHGRKTSDLFGFGISKHWKERIGDKTGGSFSVQSSSQKSDA